MDPRQWSRPLQRLAALAVAAVIAVVGVVVLAPGPGAPGGAIGAAAAPLPAATAAPRDLDAYRGHGAWVDAFDFAPAYQSSGGAPPVGPDALEEMTSDGVRTVFLQAARNDARSPQGLVDRELLAQFLVRAHSHGLRVVAWYLPKFGDVALDLRLLTAMADFEALGHRFDGLAVDIEFTEDVPDPAERGARLVQLSQAFRTEIGTDALGAIVFPPVQTEVINPALWPDFPWRELAPLYDAWLPMSYWTFRSEDSGYNDGYKYNEESTRRLRANLADPDVPIHAIGGIADLVTAEDLEGFVRSLTDTAAIGGSIYDWNTTSPDGRADLAALFADG